MDPWTTLSLHDMGLDLSANGSSETIYDEGDRNPINNQRLKLISNHNSFRVLFDKIAYVYFIRKNIFI